MEDIVLVRLGRKGLEDEEYAEELVDAFDAVWRNGLDLPGEFLVPCAWRGA